MKIAKGFLILIACLTLAAIPQIALAKGKTAVVVVDVQADFTTHHKGSLAVKGTNKAFLDNVVKATILLKKAGLPIYATQDWHPKNHMSFASNNKGKKPFQAIKLKDGRTQVMWPDHCIQGTPGAKILINKSHIIKIVQKGMNHKFDSYSGFKDDGGAKTGLAKMLKAAGVKTLIIYGIATDYCVKATVIDGLAAGFKVVVVQDLCRGVAPKTSKAAWAAMKKAGAVLWPKLDMKKAKGL